MQYHIYGLHLESNVALNELERCPSPLVPDVAFVLRQVEQTLPTLDPELSFRTRKSTDLGVDVEMYRGHCAHVLRWGDLIQFNIQDNTWRVVCYALPSASENLIRHMLYGPILSYVLHLKEVVSLHASAIALPSGAVGFLADPGVGKSTLATSFARSGHPILTDDVLVVAIHQQRVLAMPGFPWVNLSPQSLKGVLLDQGRDLEDLDFEKARVFVDGEWGAFCRTPLPLLGLCLLERGNENDIDVSRMEPRQALMKLMEHINVVPLMDRESVAKSMSLLTPLCTRVPVFRLRYPSDLTTLPLVMDTIISCTDETQTGQVAGAGI